MPYDGWYAIKPNQTKPNQAKPNQTKIKGTRIRVCVPRNSSHAF